MRYATFLVLIFILSAASVSDPSRSEENIEDVIEKYLSDFDLFYESVEDLNITSTSGTSFKSLTEQIKKCRLSYKKIEFIFDYYKTEFAYLYINGGPLPKLHKESAEIDIIAPNGLQTLDEITTSADTLIAKKEIIILAHQLLGSLQLVRSSNNDIKINKHQLIEALRSGIVRVFTLGLTGFDTPGNGNSIEESIVSLQTMRDAAIQLYPSALTKEKPKTNSLIETFDQAIAELNVSNFESLDRLDFLVSYVNPIYKNLQILQLDLGLTTDQFKNHAQNYKSNNLFDEDFINLDHYSQFTYLPLNNSKSIALGKVLFNDPILSNNLDMSCASCHNAGKAFTDNLPKSKTNVFGKFTKRNSPTLIDAGYSSKFFWDMRESDLERQVGHVISDSLEFNQSFASIIKRLDQSETYQRLFHEVYKDAGPKTINARSIANAIAAYVNSLRSFNSPFDQYVVGKRDSLSKAAKRGFNLFMSKANCGTCHFAPAFNGSVPPFYTDAESEVLGVMTNMDTSSLMIIDPDLGRSVNGRSGDAHPHFNHSFKTVTVRNSELTHPYMHNGVLSSLDEVLTFYNNGGGVGIGVEVVNQTLAPDSLGLSKSEMKDIIAFLHSLTDTSGLTQPIIELPLFEGQPYWNQRSIEKVFD